MPRVATIVWESLSEQQMLHELYACGILYQIGLAFDPADPILKKLGVKVSQDSSTGLTYEYKNVLDIVLKKLAGWRD